MKKRESFNSRWGFILACIGSAVGMGNIWMFPTRVSLYGGGSFLIPYFLFVALIGFTGVSGEMSFGRATRSGPVDAFGFACETKGKRKAGEALGLIPVLGSLYDCHGVDFQVHDRNLYRKDTVSCERRGFCRSV
mgnify:CR=1 FL=1